MSNAYSKCQSHLIYNKSSRTKLIKYSTNNYSIIDRNQPVLNGFNPDHGPF